MLDDPTWEAVRLTARAAVASAEASSEGAAGGIGDPAVLPPEVAPRALEAALRAHRLSGLAHRAMQRGRLSATPAQRAAVAAAARDDGVVALARAAELARLCAALDAAGVSTVGYKGPLLSLQAYGDAALRPGADLDLLVPLVSMPRAERVLTLLGYAPPPSMSGGQRRALFDWVGAVPWRGADGSLVELHWRVCERGLPWSLPVEALVTRAERTTLGGIRCAAPSVGDQLLLLAWHGLRHAFAQLEWLVSWAALVRRAGQPWAGVLARARTCGGARALAFSRWQARRLALLPDDASADAADAAWLAELPLPALSAALERGWRGVPGQPADDASALRRFLRPLLERRRDRARLLAAALLLPTEREWEWLRLPAALTSAYPLVRLARLTWRATVTRR